MKSKVKLTKRNGVTCVKVGRRKAEIDQVPLSQFYF